jgi:hypothetical protein
MLKLVASMSSFKGRLAVITIRKLKEHKHIGKNKNGYYTAPGHGYLSEIRF